MKDNRRRKISKGDHSVISSLYKSGKTMKFIAKRYDVSKERIRQILVIIGVDVTEARQEKIRKKQIKFREIFEKLLKEKGSIPTLYPIIKSQHLEAKYFSDLYHNLVKAAKNKGFVKIHGKSIGKEKLISELVKLSKKLKRTPGIIDINKHSIYWGDTYVCNFGSIRNAQMAAGLKPRPIGHWGHRIQ